MSHDQQALKIDIYSFAYTLPLCRITGRFVKNRHHFLFGDLGGYVSWCDKLASRPTVGFSFNKHFRPSSELLSAIVPVLDQLAGPITDKFSISKQETFSVELATESGFKYNIDPSRVAVEFQHRMQVKNTSGGMPTVEMLSKQEPYTIMLAEVGKRALEAAELLMGAGSNRMLERVGVVSTTIVDEADAPPGIKRGIEYLCISQVSSFLGNSTFPSGEPSTGALGASTASFSSFRIPDRSVQIQDTKALARAILRKRLKEGEWESLLAERQQLLDKKFSKTITKSEANRLAYVRWSLDQIEDAKHGATLDMLEASIAHYESFLEGVQQLNRDLNNNVSSQRKK